MELGLGQIFRSLNTKTQFQAFLKAFRNPSLLVGYSDNLKKKKGKGCVIWACFSSVLDQLWTCVLSFFLSFFWPNNFTQVVVAMWSFSTLANKDLDL
jgi:hypothetical protein